MSIRDRLNKLEAHPPPGDDGPDEPPGGWSLMALGPDADTSPADRAAWAEMCRPGPRMSDVLEAEIARAGLIDADD